MFLKIVGSNPRALGSECVIFGYAQWRTDAFAPIPVDTRAAPELTALGRWDVKPMRPGVGVATAPALVASQSAACRTTGKLLVLSHQWSGRLQINDVARKYTVDLYSRETRLVLLDLMREVMVDVTGLADVEDGAIRLRPLTRETLIDHIGDAGAWFRLVEPDDDLRPSLARRALALVRRKPDAQFKPRLVSRLLPRLAVAPAPAAPANAGLSDEMRLLAAAVEGLALRAPAGA